MTIDRSPEPATVTTRDSNLAQYLVHAGWRCTCHIDPSGISPIFTFEGDAPAIQANINAYLNGGTVSALAYAGAGRIVRKLLTDARSHHRADRAAGATAAAGTAHPTMRRLAELATAAGDGRQ